MAPLRRAGEGTPVRDLCLIAHPAKHINGLVRSVVIQQFFRFAGCLQKVKFKRNAWMTRIKIGPRKILQDKITHVIKVFKHQRKF